MKLKSPQPNQSFFGLRNSGRSYTSNAACFIYPLDDTDANELRGLGCVDVLDEVPAPFKPVAIADKTAVAPVQEHTEVKP